jgi:hypothetical protein
MPAVHGADDLTRETRILLSHKSAGAGRGDVARCAHVVRTRLSLTLHARRELHARHVRHQHDDHDVVRDSQQSVVDPCAGDADGT